LYKYDVEIIRYGGAIIIFYEFQNWLKTSPWFND